MAQLAFRFVFVGFVQGFDHFVDVVAFDASFEALLKRLEFVVGQLYRDFVGVRIVHFAFFGDDQLIVDLLGVEFAFDDVDRGFFFAFFFFFGFFLRLFFRLFFLGFLFGFFFVGFAFYRELDFGFAVFRDAFDGFRRHFGFDHDFGLVDVVVAESAVEFGRVDVEVDSRFEFYVPIVVFEWVLFEILFFFFFDFFWVHFVFSFFHIQIGFADGRLSFFRLTRRLPAE